MDTDSVGAVITELGGAAAVARELTTVAGSYVASSTVSSWKDRNRIDPAWWVALVAIAARLGRDISYERLARIHRRKTENAAEPAGAPQ